MSARNIGIVYSKELLEALRDRAAHDLDEWVSEETRRREAARVEQQAVLDGEWQRLIDADPNSVTATLRAATLRVNTLRTD